MATSTCYLCRLATPAPAFTKFGYTVNVCPACRLHTLDFREDYHRFISHYYNRDFFTGSPDRAGYADYEGDHFPETINMTRYLRRIKRFQPGGKLLDVGCATGKFMSHAARHGFDPYGLDVSEYAISIAQKTHRRRVKLAAIDQAHYRPKFFDLITLFDVVEHLQDPRADLLHLKQFLKPGGLLVINTGDTGSWLARLQGKDWHFFIPPQHLFFFSRQTLTQLLNQAGFEVIAIHNKGKWISLRYFLNLAKQIHRHPLARGLYPLVKDRPLGKIPLYLNLFDNIIVYARIA